MLENPPSSGRSTDLPSAPASASTDQPDQPDPIGVPSGYFVPVDRTGDWASIPPRISRAEGLPRTGQYTIHEDLLPNYFEGQEVREGVGRSEQWILQRQRDLAQAGLLSSDYIPGFWDGATQAAMRELMGYANQRGETWQRTLQAIIQQGGVGEQASGGSLQPIQHTPEWALNQLLDDAGTAYLGRNFTDQEKQQFIAAYREMENGSREQAMQADSTIARAFAQRSDPLAYAANKAVDVYDTILQTLTGGAV